MYVDHVVYHVLDVLEFTSERRRMSVIVRTPDGRIVLYCKGADSAIFPRLGAQSDAGVSHETQMHLDEYSRQGLRCLCLSFADLSPERYAETLPRVHACLSSAAVTLSRL